MSRHFQKEFSARTEAYEKMRSEQRRHGLLGRYRRRKTPIKLGKCKGVRLDNVEDTEKRIEWEPRHRPNESLRETRARARQLTRVNEVSGRDTHPPTWLQRWTHCPDCRLPVLKKHLVSHRCKRSPRPPKTKSESAVITATTITIPQHSKWMACPRCRGAVREDNLAHHLLNRCPQR